MKLKSIYLMSSLI